MGKPGSRAAGLTPPWRKSITKEPLIKSIIKTAAAFFITMFFMMVFFPIGLVAFILMFAGLKKPMSVLVYKIAQAWGRFVIAITGSRVTVTGREHIPASGGVCFVSNHVGIFDIILALAYIGRPFGFIAKKELLFLPFINVWIYILGGLFIDRKSARKALATINGGIKRLENGACMLIFPEGTRSKGRGLLPFRPGAMKMPLSSLAPIVPIAISGSYEVFEKDHRVNAAQVRLIFCPVLATQDLSGEDSRQSLADKVRSIIEAALEG